MDELLHVWTRIAWAQCWQVTLLIVSVWLVLRAVGRNRPHLACALWLVVLLKCITPPLVSSPSGIFCWLQRAEPAMKGQSVLAATEAEFVPIAASRSDAIVVRTSPAVVAPPPARAAADDLPTAGESSAGPLPLGRWSWSLVCGMAAMAWLLGALTFAVVATAQWLACWRTLTRAGRIDESPLRELVDDLRRRLRLRRSVKLLVTESSLGPAVVGLWQPTIILPAALVREKSPETLAPLVAHELIHIRRGDLWIGMLQTLAVATWWFHPLVRLASRLITREAERCCDEETIAHLGCDPAAYARSLLDVLALKQELTPIPAFPGVRPVDVTSQRLERIMQLGQGCHKRTPWWCWLITLAAAAAVLPGAALVVGAKEKPKPQPRDPQRYIRPDFPLADGELDGKPAEIVTQTYDVADLLESLAKDSGDPESAMRVLLTTLVQSAAPGPWEKEGNSSGRYTGWDEGKLVVRQTDDGHRRIEEQLAVLREHGYAQIGVEVRILSGPMAVINAEGIQWRMIGSRRADESSPTDAAVSVVEKNVPAMLALITERKAAELLDEAQGDARSNVMQAPKVTLFNGQSARVEDSVQRPFVVGVTPAADGETTTWKPTIRVFSEGTSIRLRPVAKKDGSIELDFGLTLSQIRDVETAEFPTGPGKQPITVQVPEVASTRLNTTVDLNAEQTLVLAIPKLGKGKKEQQPLCVMVKVRKITGDDAKGEVAPQVQAAVPSPQFAAMAWEDGNEPRTMTLAPGGWEFNLRPRQGHRLRITAGTQESDHVCDFMVATGLRIEAKAKSAESIDRILLEGAKASVRMARKLESGEPRKLFFEVELNDEVSGAYGETKFRADRLLLTVDDPYSSPNPITDRFRNSSPSLSPPRKPSPLKVVLEGNVQLSHNGSRIEARRVLLRIENRFAPRSASNHGPGVVQIQVDDARTIEVGALPLGKPHAPLPDSGALIEKTYPVADLVIPIPLTPLTISGDGRLIDRDQAKLDQPDFEKLIEVIKTSVEPKSWSGGGQDFRIAPVEKSLSLAIRQTAATHQKIAELLDELRSLQDQQFSLAILELRTDRKSLQRLAKEAGDKFKSLLSNREGQMLDLSAEEWELVRKIAQPAIDANRPKITLWSGQGVNLEIQPEGKSSPELLASLELQPCVMADFRHLRLLALVRFGGEHSGLMSGQSLDIPRGHCLLVDLTAAPWLSKLDGTPIIGTSQTFDAGSPKKPDERRFYLITPKVFVAAEQEPARSRQVE